MYIDRLVGILGRGTENTDDGVGDRGTRRGVELLSTLAKDSGFLRLVINTMSQLES